MSSWQHHYTPQASLERKMATKCQTPLHQVHTQPNTRATKTSRPHSRCQGHSALLQLPHHHHHREPSRKPYSQRTLQSTVDIQPKPQNENNPEVQSSYDTCPHSARHEHSTRNTPHHRQDRTAGKKQSQHYDEATRLKQVLPRSRQQETLDKTRQARHQPLAIMWHTCQTSPLNSFFLTHD